PSRACWQNRSLRVSAIIAAAGRGTRFGGSSPKQLALLNGIPLLKWSVDAFLRSDLITSVVVSLPAELAGDPPPYLFSSHKPVRVVAGGARRQDSVANAFEVAAENVDIVAIHDAARPLVSDEVIARTVRAAANTGAAIAA